MFLRKNHTDKGSLFRKENMKMKSIPGKESNIIGICSQQNNTQMSECPCGQYYYQELSGRERDIKTA